MGLEAYLEAAFSTGFVPAPATAAAVTTYINGKPGKRISILAYGCTTGSAATTITFMVPISGVASIATALTAAATTFSFSSSAVRPTNIYSGDLAVFYQDNGTYLFVSLQGTATNSVQFLVSSGTQTTMSTANTVLYYLGTAGAAGHYRRVLPTGQVQYTDADGAGIGRFFGSVMGGPMLAVMPAFGAATTIAASGEWDYITGGYINV